MKLILNYESICNEKMGSIFFLCFLRVSVLFVFFCFTITGKIHWRIGGRNKIKIAYIHEFRIHVIRDVQKFRTRFVESRAKLKMFNAVKLRLEWFSK